MILSPFEGKAFTIGGRESFWYFEALPCIVFPYGFRRRATLGEIGLSEKKVPGYVLVRWTQSV